MKKATVTWYAPIKPDEMIEVMARTLAIGRTSMTQIVEIHGRMTAAQMICAPRWNWSASMSIWQRTGQCRYRNGSSEFSAFDAK